VIKDFPGNYSEYREWKEKEISNGQSAMGNKQLLKNTNEQVQPIKKNDIGNEKRFSFKEKQEFENLEKEMPALQKEKVSLEEKMNAGNISYDELQKAAERINEIIKLLDEKEMRWLELSERI
jgi:ATP-binding cassette subfamily F protein uup